MDLVMMQERVGSKFDASTAAYVQRDFQALVGVLEGHLAVLEPVDDQARSHVIRAKAAAERGLKLSERLMKESAPGG